jgi:hypothetical protein
MTQPGLWLFGLDDIRQPLRLSIERLGPLVDEGRDFSHLAFPGANHSLVLGAECSSGSPVDFVRPMFDC